jgi:putative transposase
LELRLTGKHLSAYSSFSAWKTLHLIAVPPSKEALTGAVTETHRRYTCRVNLREGWTGHLWQGRFSSFPLDEAHLYTAAHRA